MDYTWMFYKDHENVNALLEFFAKPIKENPRELLLQIEAELHTNYVFEGNNQWGRSFVQQSAIEGVGAALEAVRAECVRAISRQENMSESQVLFTLLGLGRTQAYSLSK